MKNIVQRVAKTVSYLIAAMTRKVDRRDAMWTSFVWPIALPLMWVTAKKFHFRMKFR